MTNILCWGRDQVFPKKQVNEADTVLKIKARWTLEIS